MKRLLLALFVLAFVLSACAATPTPAPMSVSKSSAPSQTANEAYGAAPGSRDSTANSGTTDSGVRLVIKNASLEMVVDDPIATVARIQSLAGEMGGFVVGADTFTTTNEDGQEFPRGRVTIRVPAEKLDEALQKIHSMTKDIKDIRSEKITGQDVTAEYTDLKGTLANLENTEMGLVKIQDKATKTEEVMQVYRELTNIRGQIEVTKGRIKYLETSAALSAVAVELYARESVAPINATGWEPLTEAQKAGKTLVDGLKAIGTLLIWLVVLSPIWALIGGIIWLSVRGVRRSQKKSSLFTETPGGPDMTTLK